MVLAAGYLLVFLFFGVVGAQLLLPRHRPLNRLWIGLSLGLLEMMWLPALMAFFVSFGETAHWLAPGAAALLTGVCWLCRDRRPAAGWDERETTLLRQMLLVALPLTVLGGYLQYTHVMRVDAYGNWNVGQSTYGDLPMHMSFITGLVGKKFPADYPFYPGARLSYPFLTDTLSSSFYLLGCSLQVSIILPGTLMMALCFMGVMVLGREMTTGKRTVILAALLFFLNGGLGFLYDFDQAAGWEQNGQLTAVERIRAILEGYYKTPTNQPEPNNLRWSNVIADLMIPQRTLLGGWCMVIPCYYLLWAVFRPAGEPDQGTFLPSWEEKRTRWQDSRALVLLGIWAGALPLIHTHSLLALGLSSLGLMIYDGIHGDPGGLRNRKQILLRYVLYGCITAVLALPQLFAFTFGQAFQGEGTHSFLTFQFNWVNNPGGNGMRDFYLWFYVKNIGLPFLALLLAVLEKDPKQRRIFSAVLPIVAAAELIRFQPNEYDNNKLFYLAWLLCCMIVANWAAKVWERLKGTRGRYALAVMTGVAVFLSAGLTLWRECVSDYQAFSVRAVEAGEYARDHTEEDAVFLTGTQHLNPVLSIGGKTIVCGPDLWLYWHGFNTSGRQYEIRLFYEDPVNHQDIPEKYGVDYIFVSSYERASYDVDEEDLTELYPLVFHNGEAAIWKVPEDAEQAETDPDTTVRVFGEEEAELLTEEEASPREDGNG